MSESEPKKAAKPKAAKPAPKAPSKTVAAPGKLAVIRVRGKIGQRDTMLKTFAMLRLHRKNACVVIDNTPSNLGMVTKLQSFVTYGPIDAATLGELAAKRGEEAPSDAKRVIEVDGKRYSPVFRLAPPRKGFARKGVKLPFDQGGALGDRGEKIKDLIARML